MVVWDMKHDVMMLLGFDGIPPLCQAAPPCPGRLQSPTQQRTSRPAPLKPPGGKQLPLAAGRGQQQPPPSPPAPPPPPPPSLPPAETQIQAAAPQALRRAP